MGQDSSKPDGGRKSMKRRVSQAQTAGELAEAMGGYQLDDSEAALSSNLLDLVAKFEQIPRSDYEKLLAFVNKRVQSLREQIQKLSADNNAGFVSLYRTVNPNQTYETKASTMPTNTHLNRYNNVLAYDHTRVVIEPNRENFNNDYINANWIKGQFSDKTYIATQGPVPTSFTSFWQMMWENNAHIIVMVTNEVEGDKLKCHRYWPNENETSTEYGSITVTLDQERLHSSYIERRFSLTRSTEPGKTLKVVQLAYTAWPDHGVPATTKEILQFRRDVHKIHQEFKTGPIVTHCSAGVGRTGTFIGLDRFLDACLKKVDVDITDIVTDMRSCRNLMVQSQIQFVYLFLACLDGLERLCGLLRKQLKLETMTEEERQEAELLELQEQITKEEVVVGTMKGKRETPRTDSRDVFNQPKEPPASELRAAGRRPSVKERGYYDENAPNLGQRLEALVGRANSGKLNTYHYFILSHAFAPSNKRDAWNVKYDNAQKQWESSQAGGGVAYELDKDLSPLESRIQSLANANEAWNARMGANTTTAREAAALENLAGLTARLESLQASVKSVQEDWRKRGHGFREQQPVEFDRRQHTVDMLGGLLERVQMLAEDQENLMRKTTRIYHGEETFKEEVKKERAAQERRQQEMLELRERQERERQERRKREEEERKMAEAVQEAARQEEERKKVAKDRAKTVADAPKPKVYDPQERRKNMVAQAEEEARKKEEEDKAREEQQRAEAAKAKALEEQRVQSAKKANTFLSKLKQK